MALGVSEAAPDHFWMRKCGVQIAIPEEMIAERVVMRKHNGLPPFTKDELKTFRAPTVGKVMLLRGATGEELLTAILQFFDWGGCDLLMLDSVSAVLPEADADKTLDEVQKRAAAAGLLTKFFQHYLNGTTGYSGTNKTTVIFTSQVRSNSKKAEAPAHIAKYLSDYAPQGAWAAKHGKLIDILMKPGEKEKEKVANEPLSLGAAVEQKKRLTQTGKLVRYEILKGKAGIHEGITGEFPFSFTENVDKQRLLIITGLRLGIAEEKNGLVTYYDLKSRAREASVLVALLLLLDECTFTYTLMMDGRACRSWYSKAAAASSFNHPSTPPRRSREALRVHYGESRMKSPFSSRTTYPAASNFSRAASTSAANIRRRLCKVAL